MPKVDTDELIEYMKKYNPALNLVLMDPKDLVFELNTKMNCFYCGKYGNNWKCPPNLPDIDYKKMFEEFDQGFFVEFAMDITEDTDYSFIRTESSVVLHKALLEMERWFWEHDNSNVLSFGGGACKLCKNGCGKEKCNNPYRARSPIESTGINVLKSTEKYGIHIAFPANKQMKRIGLIVWQNRR